MNVYDDGHRTAPKVPGIAGKAMTRNASIGHSPNRISKGQKPAALRQTSAKAYGARPFGGRPDTTAGSRPKGEGKVDMYVIKGRKVRLTIA